MCYIIRKRWRHIHCNGSHVVKIFLELQWDFNCHGLGDNILQETLFYLPGNNIHEQCFIWSWETYVCITCLVNIYIEETTEVLFPIIIYFSVSCIDCLLFFKLSCCKFSWYQKHFFCWWNLLVNRSILNKLISYEVFAIQIS